ncbi:MAG: MCP four helix bundle domain-containing protein, partial [Pirellulaceae bacterium]|nr:MCP four helix bundle domain-containing protein [Pirellulaceae bacterium]
MKNLRLSGKIAILVGVLVVTGLFVAIVGVRQLRGLNSRMRDLVEIDARAIDLASTVRVELLAAIRSEKNAVLTSDDTESAAFAQDARAAAEQVNQILLELNPLVRDESLAIVRQDVEEFSRDWERFLDNQKEVLRLALLNTNARGAKILREEIRGRLESIVAFLDRAASASASAGTPGDADAGLG